MQLGCGSHTAAIWDRCERSRITDLDDLISVDYNRVLDNHSDAVVRVGRNGSCCSMLDQVRPWRHELVIYRDVAGQGRSQVWAGPIMEPDFGRSDTVIYARDRWAWLDKRDIRRDVTFSGDLTEVAWGLVQHGLEHPGGGVDETCIPNYVDLRPAGETGTRSWKGDSGSVGSELRRMARGIINVTFWGRRMIIWGAYPLSETDIIQDKDILDEIRVSLDGWSMATRVIVQGKEFVRSCGGADDYFGLIESEISDDSITDPQDGLELACSEAATRSRPPLVLSVPNGARLAPDAPVTLDELVPGVLIPIWSKETCLEVSADLVLTRVQVYDDSRGERVAITVSPGTILGSPNQSSGV